MLPIISKFIDVYVFTENATGFEFLLLKRAKDNRYENIWHPVSGKIKENETAYHAAIREFKEETSLEYYKLYHIDYTNHFYYSKTDENYLYPCFAIEVKEREVRLNHEHSEYKWLSYKEAQTMLIWRNHREALSQLYNDICMKNYPEKLTFLEIK
jgi:dihydroneopterin triphosphate diphosphatase